jgi:hypothetical protein
VALNNDTPWPSVVDAKLRVLSIQRKLHQWSKTNSERRFDDLYNLVCDRATLLAAWERPRRPRQAVFLRPRQRPGRCVPQLPPAPFSGFHKLASALQAFIDGESRSLRLALVGTASRRLDLTREICDTGPTVLKEEMLWLRSQ